MIEYAKEPFSDSESLAVLHPYIKAWFSKHFTELTPPQKYAFKDISDGKNILITAPTGSGKTMSGFLSIISNLLRMALDGKLEDKVYCLYVSPLRALNNDIYKNLAKPIDEIYESLPGKTIRKAGKEEEIRKITVGLRTGDTPQKERHRQLVRPPNILVTTPESLAIMINSQKFVEKLKDIKYLIIDEIHELANNKRGVHLSLSVERLAEIAGHDFVRIGMGATLYPLDEAARYLAGYSGSEPRDCIIADASWSKKLDVMAMSPVRDMIYEKEENIENALYKELNRIIRHSKTTLIFTNTRSGTERVVFNLKKRFRYKENIAAHHGSLSRESRLEVEDLLKKGALKCAVSSTSLELGMDIGTIDNVVQLGSPKSVTRAVQRIGRAGHSFKATAKGEMLALNRDDLVECTIMLDAALKRHLDSFSVPQNPLDVLAQHIVGMSLTKKWDVDEAYGTIRHAYAYHNLDRNDFMSLLDYLAGNYAGLESKHVYGKIWYDEKEKAFGKRGKYARVIYMLNLGTIPDEVAVNVFTPDKKWIGNIEEEFLMRLKPGDIFTLGGHLYKFEYAKTMKAFVTPAAASAPTIPPWFSEQLPLSYELANEIGAFRRTLGEALQKEISAKPRIRLTKRTKIHEEAKAILDSLPADANAKQAIFGYFMEQLLFAGAMPNDMQLLIEQTSNMKDEKGYLVFHALFGRRVNDALSRLFAISVSEKFACDVGMMVGDNGFVLVTDGEVKIREGNILDIIREMEPSSLRLILEHNIRKTELMKRRFRHVASRGLMILRNYKGWKIGVRKQQVNSQLLLDAVEEMDPNFPLLKETYREILNDSMDIQRAKEVVTKLRDKGIAVKFIKTAVPSPFSHNLLTFGHADIIMMKGRKKYLQRLHRLVMKRINSGSVTGRLHDA